MEISVIIPLYNAEKYIKKTIQSCLEIDVVKEIIVIDDGYKDGAKAIVKKLAELHSIIKLYEHFNNENRGAGESRNLGIEMATQEYIAFLDADDFFLPNRFQKDKEVFENNPDADGCYNAIGAHFYSKKAEEQFFNTFSFAITTVNKNINPNPDNLFSGLIGLIPQYGYFSLDGLIIKRQSLINSKVKFTNLRIHQDTEFLIRLSHYCKLYPSEIENPVAMRGVHEENRITKNDAQEKQKVYHNRFLQWKETYNWAKQNEVTKNQLRYIKEEYDFFRLMSVKQPKTSSLFKEIFLNRNILKNRRYFLIHKYYWGKLPLSHKLFELRNFVVKYS